MIDLIKLLEYEDLRESHKKIVDCIGLEEFKTLVRYFDGKAFSVPKLQSIIPIIKRRIILEDFYIRKLSKNKIAEKHNVSIDYVNRIIYFSEAGQSEIRKANDDRQTRDQSIVHDYTQFHLSPNQIAEKYDLSPNRVRVILKEHDIFPSENHLISAEIKDKIIFDYSETDMTKSEIAKKYNVSVGYIATIIKKAKKPLRRTEMARSHQERNEQIIYDYKTLKLSYKQLSEKYTLNTVTIYDIIHSRQKPKSYVDKQRKRQTRDQSIVHDYTQFHLSLNQIAEKYELSPNRVRDIIREHGISTSERPLISAEIKAMIISDYNETDMTLSDIVEKYGVTEPTIIKFIKISKNPLRKTRTAESRQERNKQIIYDYKTLKLSVKELSEKYGLSKSSIRNILNGKQKSGE